MHCLHRTVLLLCPELAPPKVFYVILTARDSRWMRNSNSAQQAVFRPVQLPLCAVWRRPCRAGSWDRGLQPAGPLLPLRPIQSSHRHRACALWSRGPREASDGGRGLQVWDEPWGKKRLGCSLCTHVTVLNQNKVLSNSYYDYCNQYCNCAFVSLNVLFRETNSGGLFHLW